MKVLSLLIIGVCVASGKYLPEKSNDSEEIQGSSVKLSLFLFEEKEQNENSEKILDNSPEEEEKETINQKQIEKLKLKQEEQERKMQEKTEKQERKLREKIQKEEYKKEVQEKKRKEKMEKKERKRLDKEIKQNGNLGYNSAEIVINLPNQSEKDSVSEEDETMDVDHGWKLYIYTKYGLSPSSMTLEKETAINKYIEEEFKLAVNSTQSERRQAVIRLLQLELQNSTDTESSFKNYLFNQMNESDLQDLKTILDWNNKKFSDELKILEAINTTWASISQKYVGLKRTFLQSLTTLLSNWIPSWETSTNTPNNLTTNTIDIPEPSGSSYDNSTPSDTEEILATTEPNSELTTTVPSDNSNTVLPTSNSLDAVAIDAEQQNPYTTSVGAISSQTEAVIYETGLESDNFDLSSSSTVAASDIETTPNMFHESLNFGFVSMNPSTSTLETTTLTLLSTDQSTTITTSSFEVSAMNTNTITTEVITSTKVLANTETTMVADSSTPNLVAESTSEPSVYISNDTTNSISEVTANAGTPSTFVSVTSSISLSSAAGIDPVATAAFNIDNSAAETTTTITTDGSTLENLTTSNLIQAGASTVHIMPSVSNTEPSTTQANTPSDLVSTNVVTTGISSTASQISFGAQTTELYESPSTSDNFVTNIVASDIESGIIDSTTSAKIISTTISTEDITSATFRSSQVAKDGSDASELSTDIGETRSSSFGNRSGSVALP